MSDVVQKFVIVSADTGQERGSYYSQAPATALALRLSRNGNQFNVEKREYILASTSVVRCCKNREIL